jgi:hypothetical protein
VTTSTVAPTGISKKPDNVIDLFPDSNISEPEKQPTSTDKPDNRDGAQIFDFPTSLQKTDDEEVRTGTNNESVNENKIPAKQVMQGYVVEYNTGTQTVSISQRGQLLKQYKLSTPSRRAYEQTVGRFISAQEDDKYPTDIEDRDVVLPTKRVAEELPAKAAKELHRWKNQQTQSTASTEVVPAEPQPVPARLSDLQSKKQRIDDLASIKQEIEKLQARATRGGRMLPRGLAADLEDYFTTADIDTAYDDMMNKYQKQLGALQQYLGMRKALWSPKKDVHEMKAKELQEGGPETWTVYFTDGTKTQVRVPNDETDPAKVRAFFAKKGKTVKKFDYGFGTEPEAGPGPERHEPGSGSAVSARTGDALPENAVDRSGSPMYKKQEAYMIVHNGRDIAFYKPSDMKKAYDDAEELVKKHGGEVHVKKVMREGRAGNNPLTSKDHWYEVERHLSQLINDRTLDPESRAEARQRYLEKRKEAQQKGWAK